MYTEKYSNGFLSREQINIQGAAGKLLYLNCDCHLATFITRRKNKCSLEKTTSNVLYRVGLVTMVQRTRNERESSAWSRTLQVARNSHSEITLISPPQAVFPIGNQLFYGRTPVENPGMYREKTERLGNNHPDIRKESSRLGSQFCDLPRHRSAMGKHAAAFGMSGRSVRRTLTKNCNFISTNWQWYKNLIRAKPFLTIRRPCVF